MPPGQRDGWVCQLDSFPAIVWFSATDQTSSLPLPITCHRVDKTVAGESWRTWASWFKLIRYLDRFPF